MVIDRWTDLGSQMLACRLFIRTSQLYEYLFSRPNKDIPSIIDSQEIKYNYDMF
jgi:hypothetical protein